MPGAMDADSLGVPVSAVGNRKFDGSIYRLTQLPQGRRAAVAEKGIRATREERSRLSPQRNRHGRPNGVDGWMYSDQAPCIDEPPDCGVRNPRCQQLPPHHVTVLKLRDPRDPLVATARNGHR
jgi:hypothetical protein